MLSQIEKMHYELKSEKLTYGIGFYIEREDGAQTARFPRPVAEEIFDELKSGKNKIKWYTNTGKLLTT